MYFNHIISFSIRFLHVPELLSHDEMLIDRYFANFFTSSPEKPTTEPTLIQQILEMDEYSPKDQFAILSLISKYHKYGYPSLKQEGGIIHVRNLSYAEHVFFDEKFSNVKIDGEEVRTYILPSPRNRIVYFLDTAKERDLYQLVKHILKGDQIGLEVNEEFPQDDPPPVPKKERKHSSHLVSVFQRAVFAEVGANMNTQLNCTNPNHTLYQVFEEQLITEDIIKWQLHDDNKDICLMNDIKATRGHLMPQSSMLSVQRNW